MNYGGHRQSEPAVEFLFLGTMLMKRSPCRLPSDEERRHVCRTTFQEQELPRVLQIARLRSPSYIEGFGLAVSEQLDRRSTPRSLTSPTPPQDLLQSHARLLTPGGR